MSPARAGSGGGSLAVFGIGPRSLPQLTLETMEAMKACDEVHGATTFQQALAEFCRGWGVPYRELDWGDRPAVPNGATTPGSPPLEGIAERLLARVAGGAKVGLMVDGHPALFSFASDLLRRCRERGLPCRTYAAVSSLDQILVALEPVAGAALESGVAAYSVLSPGLETERLSADLGALLYNVGHLLKGSPEAFGRLLERLRAEYGGGHRVYLVECAPDGDTVRACPIEDLRAQLALVGVNATVFVPRAARP